MYTPQHPARRRTRRLRPLAQFWRDGHEVCFPARRRPATRMMSWRWNPQLRTFKTSATNRTRGHHSRSLSGSGCSTWRTTTARVCSSNRRHQPRGSTGSTRRMRCRFSGRGGDLPALGVTVRFVRTPPAVSRYGGDHGAGGSIHLSMSTTRSYGLDVTDESDLGSGSMLIALGGLLGVGKSTIAT